MHKRLISFIFIALISISYINIAAAGDWRFPLAISYVQGAKDVADLYEQNIEHEVPNSSVSSTVWPFGLSFHPYFEFDFGLGIGVGIGPISIIYVDTGTSYGEYDFTNVPVNVDARFNFLPKNSFAPYIRAGVRKNNASGDYVVSDGTGLFYGIGAEFRSLKHVNFAVEIAKDESEIEFYVVDNNRQRSSTKKIKPTGTMISFYVIF